MREDGRLEGGNGFLFPFRRAADMGPEFAEPPLFVVCHYTAGSHAEADLSVLTRRDSTYVSAHFHIARDGDITQLVPLTHVAWHAGRSWWTHDGVRHQNLNACSIGIEFANAGWLNVIENGFATRSDLSLQVPLERTIRATHRNGWPKDVCWETYPDRQIEQGEGLVRLLVSSLPSLVDVVGHDQIAPDRKQDPGPAFPLSVMRAALQGAKSNATS